MSYAACAEIVRRGDPDRFLATMAAPVSKRAALIAVYAFNVEVSRAAWASKEPMVCEIRLQYWRDILDQLEAGETGAQHEITAPLSDIVDTTSADILRRLINARRWDVHGKRFDDFLQLGDYLNDTAGGLMWVAAKAIGIAEGEAAIREVGYASGLAKWFQAVPELVDRGRKPLPTQEFD